MEVWLASVTDSCEAWANSKYDANTRTVAGGACPRRWIVRPRDLADDAECSCLAVGWSYAGARRLVVARSDAESRLVPGRCDYADADARRLVAGRNDGANAECVARAGRSVRPCGAAL